jgi:hypothetical protein
VRAPALARSLLPAVRRATVCAAGRPPGGPTPPPAHISAFVGVSFSIGLLVGPRTTKIEPSFLMGLNKAQTP